MAGCGVLSWSFVLWGLLVGVFGVWLYAAIRPNYDTGPKTALCAGSVVWGLTYLIPSVSMILLNVFPRRIFAIGLSVGLVEVLVATQIGTRLYQEPSALRMGAILSK
jgi:hypothetical protein